MKRRSFLASLFAAPVAAFAGLKYRIAPKPKRLTALGGMDPEVMRAAMQSVADAIAQNFRMLSDPDYRLGSMNSALARIEKSTREVEAMDWNAERTTEAVR